MAGARRASCGGHTPSACESGEPDEARGLAHQLQADTREQAVLLSGSQAEAFLLPELLLALVLGARRAGSLSFGNDRDCEGYHTNPRQSSFRTFSCGKVKLHRFSNTALGRRPSSATSDPPPILGKLPHLRGPHFCHLLVACSFSGFPRGDRLSWVSGLTRGQEVAKSWNSRL